MILERRKFLTGLVSLIAAPAIVRVASIMPVRAIPHQYVLRTSIPAQTWCMFNQGVPYGRSPAMDALPSMIDLQKAIKHYGSLLGMPADAWREMHGGVQ